MFCYMTRKHKVVFHCVIDEHEPPIHAELKKSFRISYRNIRLQGVMAEMEIDACFLDRFQRMATKALNLETLKDPFQGMMSQPRMVVTFVERSVVMKEKMEKNYALMAN